SFAKVLQGNIKTHRKYAFGMHNNYPEGPPYPIRSITNGEWRYIRNLTPDATYIEKHLMGRTVHNPYWPSWLWTSTEKPRSRELVERFLHRPAEELYHTVQDRYELTNLANNPAHAELKKTLSDALDAQLADQKDPGIPLDTPKAHRAASKLEPLFPSKP
ncbi:MAG: heparan N-sulfatase, partial [Akkermansiaceae bacterium]